MDEGRKSSDPPDQQIDADESRSENIEEMNAVDDRAIVDDIENRNVPAVPQDDTDRSIFGNPQWALTMMRLGHMISGAYNAVANSFLTNQNANSEEIDAELPPELEAEVGATPPPQLEEEVPQPSEPAVYEDSTFPLVIYPARSDVHLLRHLEFAIADYLDVLGMFEPPNRQNLHRYLRSVTDIPIFSRPEIFEDTPFSIERYLYYYFGKMSNSQIQERRPLISLADHERIRARINEEGPIMLNNYELAERFFPRRPPQQLPLPPSQPVEHRDSMYPYEPISSSSSDSNNPIIIPVSSASEVVDQSQQPGASSVTIENPIFNREECNDEITIAPPLPALPDDSSESLSVSDPTDHIQQLLLEPSLEDLDLKGQKRNRETEIPESEESPKKKKRDDPSGS